MDPGSPFIVLLISSHLRTNSSVGNGKKQCSWGMFDQLDSIACVYTTTSCSTGYQSKGTTYKLLITYHSQKRHL